MQIVRKLRSRFARDQRGIETVEWAVIATILVAGLITVMAGLGSNVLNTFTTLLNATK